MKLNSPLVLEAPLLILKLWHQAPLWKMSFNGRAIAFSNQNWSPAISRAIIWFDELITAPVFLLDTQNMKIFKHCFLEEAPREYEKWEYS